MLRTVISQLFSFALALIFAIVIWVVATNEENPNRQDYYPQAIPIEIVNRGDNLVVYQQSADTTRVLIRAPETTWQNLRGASFHAMVDLNGRGAGVYSLPIVVTSADSSVRVLDSDPREIQIQLERLAELNLAVHAQVTDEPPLGYETHTPTITPDHVKVSGPQVLMDQVSDAIATIAIHGAKAPIEAETNIVVRDAQGKELAGLTVNPSTVQVQLPIVQSVGYKEVAIKPVLKGNVASGYWISNLTVEPSTATLVGPADTLAKIPGYIETQPIDVTDARSFIITRATITLPDSVSLLKDGGDITVRVTIDPLRGGQTLLRKIRIVNLAPDLKATVSPDTVEVILSGPLPVLASLTANDVDIVVDATGLAPGTYQLKPTTQLIPSALKVESIVPDTVEVVITK